MLTALIKLLKALNSEQAPWQLASGVCLAMVLGFTPLLSLHNLLILLVLLTFRINLGIFLLSWPLMTLMGLVFEPFFQHTGLTLLQQPELLPLWESFYNTLPGRWSNFYYSGVLGGLVVALGLALVSFPLLVLAIGQYREKLQRRFDQWHISKLIKASRFWQLYQSHS